MKLRISWKIFLLALLGVFLMSIGSILSIFLVSNVAGELDAVARYHLTLEKSAAAIEAHAIEYELHIERLATLNREKRGNSPVAQKESRMMGERAETLAKEIHQARQLLEEGERKQVIPPELQASLNVRFQNIEDSFARYRKHASSFVEESKKGYTDQAIWMEDRLQEEEDVFNQSLERLRQEVGSEVDGAVQRARDDEQKVMISSIGLTVLALALALVVAGYITRGLVRPIHDLLTGTRKIEEGDLDVNLPVSTGDEVGQLTAAFNHMTGELKLKERIRDTFGRFVDPRIVAELIENQEEGAGDGQKRIMTVFFSDIAGFTEMGEKLSPNGLVRMINAYLTQMAEPIRANRGVIDKFIGDAIMAYWGPPFSGMSNHADLAARSALEQMKSLQKFREDLPEILGLNEDFSGFHIRIGLASGELVVGEMGSENAKNYTVMGDVVNLASRLEAINKQYGTGIIVSEGTAQMLSDGFKLRELDIIRVKGKQQPVAIFELLGSPGDELSFDPGNIFQKGLEFYRQRNWDQALEAFSELGDAPSRIYSARIRHFKANPPPEDWDGVWAFKTK